MYVAVKGGEAAIENALSRIYLGVHFPFDGTDGNAAGTALGRHVVATSLLPTCRSNWDGQPGVTSGDISAFLATWLASVPENDPFADFNNDGVTNSGDISAYLTQWIAELTGGC